MKTNSRWWILLVIGALAICSCAGIVTLGAMWYLRANPTTTQAALTFSPAQLPNARLDEPYQVLITVSNNETPVFDMGVENGNLPPGLTFTYNENSDTAEISGIPKANGVFTFNVSAVCFGTNISGQAGSHEYTLVVEGE